MCPAIQDLYNLLKSNTAYIPPLILEYVLATCIHSTLVSQEDAGLPTIKYLSESDYKCICATINNEQPNIHKSELDSILNKIQDITYYKDFCFQNTQFYHLFFMTEHQLYRSGLIIRNGTAPKTDIIYDPEQFNTTSKGIYSSILIRCCYNCFCFIMNYKMIISIFHLFH